ncbi:MAG: dicarboxylate/amino acid:cation symporter [Flavobacteriales bacterium]|nr:dicarboxylate/amino acid:cation symporter [Flavobacteriales bacterium]
MTDTSAPRPILALQDMYRHLQRLVETRLWLKVLIAMFLGIGLGVALSGDAALVPSRIAAPLIDWLALPGLLFIRLIQMIMIPLVVSSVIRGIVGGGDPAELKVLGPQVAMFFLIFTVAAIIIGIGVASWLRPGDLLAAQGWATDVSAPAIATERPTVTSFITDLLPENPLASMVSGEMLSIVAFAIIAGIAMLSLDAPTAEPVIRLLGAVQEICMTIIRWAMKLAPLAVFGLMCQVTASVGWSALSGLGMYVFAVLLSMALLALSNVLVSWWCGVKPGKFLAGCRDMMLLAFSTASSAAVMPLSLKTAMERFHIRESIARFVVPVGTIINMNGTAAFQAIAAIFLAQVYGLDLGTPAIVMMVVTTVAASIGTPSAPGAGVIVLATVLSSVGIPVEGIGIIIGVDRILGMVRSSLNVMNDMTTCIWFERKARNAEG